MLPVKVINRPDICQNSLSFISLTQERRSKAAKMGRARKPNGNGNGHAAGGGPPYSSAGFFQSRKNLKETAKHGSGTAAGVQAGMRSVFEATSKQKRQEKQAAKRAITPYEPEVT